MERKLSKNSISTYCGNVVSLRLLGDEEFDLAKIRWKSDNENIAQITEYKNYYNTGEFTNGVLITCLKEGEATVTAKYGKKTY